MATKQLRFFSSQENDEAPVAAQPAEPTPLTGSITTKGKLVFSLKTLQELGIEPTSTQFQVAGDSRKRKSSALYLIPTTDANADGFGMGKVGRSYGLSLGGILRKVGIDYSGAKQKFSLKPFTHEGGVNGYELQLDKAPVGDKPARKPRKPRTPKAAATE